MEQRTSRYLLGLACALAMMLSSCGGNGSISKWLNEPLNKTAPSVDTPALLSITQKSQKNEVITAGPSIQITDNPISIEKSETPFPTPIPPTNTSIPPSDTPKPTLRLDVIPVTIDDYENFNSLLVSHAMIKLDILNNKNTGHFSTDLTLKKGASYGLFAWCLSKEDRLQDVLSKISYKMQVDGAEIDTSQFGWIYHRDTNGNYCAFPGALVTNIQKGTYHIVITETIHSKFSSGAGNYEPGDYIYDMKISFN